MFEWAEKYPEIIKICNNFQLFEFEHPVHFQYTPLNSLLQEGPQCGLVALAMCTENPTKEIVDQLFNTAKHENFTNNGEMFSANNLTQLAKTYITSHEVKLYKGSLDETIIKDKLLNGGMLLVPYDTDKNFTPCKLNGHKAHWAVISGCIVTECDFYVIARHGKARNIAIWNIRDLSESNLQLNVFSPDRKLSDLTYKLPDGGLNGPNGISGFSVLLTNKEQLNG